MLRGIAVPAIIILLFALAFYHFLTDPSALVETGYFYSDYPLSILLLIILNMCYGFAYMAAYIRNLQREMGRIRTDWPMEREIGGAIEGEGQGKKPGTYSLSDEVGEHAIPYDEICYFRMCTVEGNGGMIRRYIELVCNDGKKFKAKEDSLVQIVALTDGVFKQVCRRYLAAQHAIDSCIQRGDSGKLIITLLPDGIEVELSIRSSVQLKDWILEKVSTIPTRASGDADNNRRFGF